jgi:hypothetical protein
MGDADDCDYFWGKRKWEKKFGAKENGRRNNRSSLSYIIDEINTGRFT